MDDAGELKVVDLDGIATSTPELAVVDAMVPWLSRRHAHPASLHARGLDARIAVEESRREVAALVGSGADEIVFTSGATEANNLGLKGAAALARRRGSLRIAVPAHEHISLLHPARSLRRAGWILEEIGVERDGLVKPESPPFDAPLGVVAFSHAHAELGALQPAAEICARSRSQGASVLLDATLTAGRVPVDLKEMGNPDLVTLSFHHMGGPMGVGALVVRAGLPIPPLLEGGAEEGGYRPGSPNLAGIVGAGVAARLARESMGDRCSALARLGEILMDGVLSIPCIRRTGPPLASRLPGHISFLVEGVDGEALIVALASRGVLAATGSPCASQAGLPSACLLAAGYTATEARGAMVFSIPPTAGPDEAGILQALCCLREELRRLLEVSGGVARARG